MHIERHRLDRDGQALNPHISPVFRNLAPDRYHWVTVWTEGHSRSYGLREDQAQWYMNKPGPE